MGRPKYWRGQGSCGSTQVGVIRLRIVGSGSGDPSDVLYVAERGVTLRVVD